MTEVEYTEQALDHLSDLESQVADRVMNEVDEAIFGLLQRLERLCQTLCRSPILSNDTRESAAFTSLWLST